MSSTPPHDPSIPSGANGAPAGSPPPTAAPAPGSPRFRRPDRPAPAAGDVRALGDADGVPPDGAFDAALAPAGASRAIAEPLAALAAAFQANADALRKSQEIQNDLGRALQRADRSEALLQSTGALNETFRGLTQVQRSLSQRIDTSDQEARNGRWFLPVLTLAALAVVGVGLWLVLQYVNRWREDALGTVDVATQLAEQYQKGVAQGREDARTASDADRKASDERIRRLEEDLKAMEAARDAKATAVADAQRSLEAAQAEMQAGRVDGLKARAIEEEAIRLRLENAAQGPEIERLKRDIASEKSANAGLRQRMADLGLGRIPAADAPPRADPAADAAAAAAAASAPDRTLSRDRRAIDQNMERLNDLLSGSAGGRPDSLQLTRVGGIGAQRLTDVTVQRLAPGGKVVNGIRAKELRITVDRLRRVVEFVFADGSLEHGATSVPFPGGTYSVVVAEGDSVSTWTGSGLTLLTPK